MQKINNIICQWHYIEQNYEYGCMTIATNNHIFIIDNKNEQKYLYLTINDNNFVYQYTHIESIINDYYELFQSDVVIIHTTPKTRKRKRNMID